MTMEEEDWHSLLDHTQHLFQALSMPFRLIHLLHHLLAMCHAPVPSKTLLVKVLSSRPKEVPGGRMASRSGTSE